MDYEIACNAGEAFRYGLSAGFAVALVVIAAIGLIRRRDP